MASKASSPDVELPKEEAAPNPSPSSSSVEVETPAEAVAPAQPDTAVVAPTSTAQEQPAHIEAEADYAPDNQSNFDIDSAYGEELGSITTSLSSSVTNYRYENGRRYHAHEDGRYFLPNDEKESDRLDLFHHLLTLRCDDKLHLAPIGSSPQRILDLGTGTGIWAIEMGDAYPSAEVLGNDLSPTQPALTPPNVHFEVDDIENTWCFSHPFDYIHCRYLAGSIGDWPHLMAQAFRFLKPGGWVEFQDFDMKFYSTDGSFEPGSSPDVWTQEIVKSLEVFGKEPEPGPKLEGWVREAGFENVVHHLLPIPVGPWPLHKRMKEIGACDLSMFLEGLEAISLRALTNGRNWKPEEVLVFLPGVRRDLLNRRIHAQHNFHVVYGQKPLNTESL